MSTTISLDDQAKINAAWQRLLQSVGLPNGLPFALGDYLAQMGAAGGDTVSSLHVTGATTLDGAVSITSATTPQITGPSGATFQIAAASGQAMELASTAAPINFRSGASFQFVGGGNIDAGASNIQNVGLITCNHVTVTTGDVSGANAGAGGNATSNTTSGIAAIASGASAAIITSAYCAAGSLIFVTLQTAAAGVGGLVAVNNGNGTFTVTSVNGTGVVTNTSAKAKFSWFILN